jgi:hypothetical protein
LQWVLAQSVVSEDDYWVTRMGMGYDTITRTVRGEEDRLNLLYSGSRSSNSSNSSKSIHAVRLSIQSYIIVNIHSLDDIFVSWIIS